MTSSVNESNFWSAIRIARDFLLFEAVFEEKQKKEEDDIVRWLEMEVIAECGSKTSAYLR